MDFSEVNRLLNGALPLGMVGRCTVVQTATGPTAMFTISSGAIESTDIFRAGDLFTIDEGLGGVMTMLGQRVHRAIFEHHVYSRSRLWC